MTYSNIVSTISTVFDAKFNEITATYNFDLGDEFEIVLCEVLQHFLPEKCGICRGFVVNSDGETAGDDIIIFDKNSHSPVRNLSVKDFGRKQQIPVEAVYGYIEAKSTIYLEGGENNLLHALEQQYKVRQLIQSRKPRSLGMLGDIEIPNNNIHETQTPGYPSIKNPPFTAVWAKNVKIKQSSSANCTFQDICDHLLGLKLENARADCIVLGKQFLLLPAIKGAADGRDLYSGPFYVDGKMFKPCEVHSGSAYATGLCVMNEALNWINLNSISWGRVVVDSLIND